MDLTLHSNVRLSRKYFSMKNATAYLDESSMTRIKVSTLMQNFVVFHDARAREASLKWKDKYTRPPHSN